MPEPTPVIALLPATGPMAAASPWLISAGLVMAALVLWGIVANRPKEE
jgi:hypothetical protein